MIDQSPPPSTSSRIQDFLSDCLSRVSEEHPNAIRACSDLASLFLRETQSAKGDTTAYRTRDDPLAVQEQMPFAPSRASSLDTQTAPCTTVAECEARNARRRNQLFTDASISSTQVPDFTPPQCHLSHAIQQTGGELSTSISDYQSSVDGEDSPSWYPQTPSPSTVCSQKATSSIDLPLVARKRQSADSIDSLSPPKIDFKPPHNPSEISIFDQESSPPKRIGEVDAKPSDYPISPEALPSYNAGCDSIDPGVSPNTGGGDGDGGGGGFDLGDLGGDCVIQ